MAATRVLDQLDRIELCIDSWIDAWIDGLISGRGGRRAVVVDRSGHAVHASGILAGGYGALGWCHEPNIAIVPEGDHIHRAAAALRTALAGKPIVRFEAVSLVEPLPAVGRVVERVESHGKHLDIMWDDGLVLHTNLRSRGSWHLYRQGERWRESVAQLRVEIHTEQWVAACFGAPVVETYRQFDRSRHPGFGPLGPDLCRLDADLDESINRLYHYHDQQAAVAEALLDEHIARGIGNVYRCEALWACRLHPFAPISSLAGDDCADVVTAAAALVCARVHHTGSGAVTLPPAAETAPGHRVLDVYGRNGQRCAHCGDTIHVCRSGDHAHLLYWCPGCQVRRSPFVEEPSTLDPVMDPHPAAAKFLSQLPWRRGDPLAG